MNEQRRKETQNGVGDVYYMNSEQMALRKEEVINFLNGEWFPDFISLFARETSIGKRLVMANTPSEVSSLITKFTEAAAIEILKKRDVIFREIDNFKRED